MGWFCDSRMVSVYFAEGGEVGVEVVVEVGDGGAEFLSLLLAREFVGEQVLAERVDLGG